MTQKKIFLQGEGDKWFERNLISQNYFLRYKKIFNHNKDTTDIYEEDSRVSINILLKTNDFNRE